MFHVKHIHNICTEVTQQKYNVLTFIDVYVWALGARALSSSILHLCNHQFLI